jgi:hypothetical protein
MRRLLVCALALCFAAPASAADRLTVGWSVPEENIAVAGDEVLWMVPHGKRDDIVAQRAGGQAALVVSVPAPKDLAVNVFAASQQRVAVATVAAAKDGVTVFERPVSADGRLLYLCGPAEGNLDTTPVAVDGTAVVYVKQRCGSAPQLLVDDAGTTHELATPAGKEIETVAINGEYVAAVSDTGLLRVLRWRSGETVYDVPKMPTWKLKLMADGTAVAANVQPDCELKWASPAAPAEHGLGLCADNYAVSGAEILHGYHAIVATDLAGNDRVVVRGAWARNVVASDQRVAFPRAECRGTALWVADTAAPSVVPKDPAHCPLQLVGSRRVRLHNGYIVVKLRCPLGCSLGSEPASDIYVESVNLAPGRSKRLRLYAGSDRSRRRTLVLGTANPHSGTTKYRFKLRLV